MSKNGDLRVWWIPQVPMKKHFSVDIPNKEIAIILLKTLADYDIFQFENRIKPDYCNAGGLLIYENGDWSDWEDEEGDDINAYINGEKS